MGEGGIGKRESRSTITVIQKAIKLSVDLIRIYVHKDLLSATASI